MNEDVVWLYKVLEAEKMSAKELQSELDRWSNHYTPHELIKQGDKLIIKYQSALNRSAYMTQIKTGIRNLSGETEQLGG